MDRLRRTLTSSAASAIAPLLMIGAITVGATVIRPLTLNPQPDAAAQADATGSAGEPTADGPDGFASGAKQADGAPDGADVDAKAFLREAPTAPPAPPSIEPTEKPASAPPSDPKSAPSTDLTLAAVFIADLGKIVVEWSAYAGAFDKYKLVRSTDATATWPLGEGDQLVDVVGADGARRFVDANAPCNMELHSALSRCDTPRPAISCSPPATWVRRPAPATNPPPIPRRSASS